MPKYIEEKELREWVENWLYKDRWYHNGRVSKNIPIPELYDILERMPTADVVEVVRCEHCVHSEWVDDNSARWCDVWGNDAEDDGFCKYGERREDELHTN